MVAEFGERARYVDEDYGNSARGEQLGVERYPAVFVDDVLVARPEDFYAWDGAETGRYLPWRSEEGHRRFKADLRRMIELRLAGGEQQAREAAEGALVTGRALPALDAEDLDGRRVDSASLLGRPLVVELWATWCPPCLTTLDWLRELHARDPEGPQVLGIALASEESDVRRLAAERRLGYPLVMGDDAMAESFGNPMAVPTLYVFDSQGRLAGSFFGAPPDLYPRVEALLARLQ